MNTRADDLHEARRIVTALERCQLRNDGDRRFCATWANYMRSAGADWTIQTGNAAPRGSELRH